MHINFQSDHIYLNSPIILFCYIYQCYSSHHEDEEETNYQTSSRKRMGITVKRSKKKHCIAKKQRVQNLNSNPKKTKELWIVISPERECEAYYKTTNFILLQRCFDIIQCLDDIKNYFIDEISIDTNLDNIIKKILSGDTTNENIKKILKKFSDKYFKIDRTCNSLTTEHLITNIIKLISYLSKKYKIFNDRTMEIDSYKIIEDNLNLNICFSNSEKMARNRKLMQKYKYDYSKLDFTATGLEMVNIESTKKEKDFLSAHLPKKFVSKTELHPTYIFIDSEKEFGFFFSNYTKDDKTIKIVEFGDYLYRIIGFITESYELNFYEIKKGRVYFTSEKKPSVKIWKDFILTDGEYLSNKRVAVILEFVARRNSLV